MTYTEIKEKNTKKYFYRVRTLRQGPRFKKERIYLGNNLSKEDLVLKEKEADIKLKKRKRKKELDKIIPLIRNILKKNNIKKAGIFGSYVRNEQKNNSDIDIIVEYPKGLGGFDFIGIQFDLEKKLKRKVDLVTYNSLHPLIKERILNEETKII